GERSVPSLLMAILRWEPSDLGPYETVRARLMHRTVLALAVGVAMMVPAAFVSGGLALAFLPLGFVFAYGVVLILMHYGQQQVAAVIVLSLAVLVEYALAVPFGGLRGTMPIQLMLTATLAVTWLEPRAAWMLVAVEALLPALTPTLARAW